MFNKCFFIGRLTKDFSLSFSPDGKSYGFGCIAVNRKDEKCDFVNISAYGKTAENISNYLKKGDASLFQCKYEHNRKDGKDYHNFIVERFEFLPTNKGLSIKQAEDFFSK